MKGAPALLATVVVLLVLAARVSSVLAQRPETAGMITEIKPGTAAVQVKSGRGDWGPAAPLQAMRAGDQVRASGDAAAVVLLASGRGAVRVEARNSPYTVPGPGAGAGAGTKAAALLAASLGFLSSGSKEAPTALLATRGIAGPPVILTPRNGPVLPGSIVFEWVGRPLSRYTVRVLGPSGVVLERTGVAGARFAYPDDAPPLDPGVRYRFQVEALDHRPYEAWFEVVDRARATAIREDVARLAAQLGAGISPSSLAAVTAGALASQGLFHDARLVALAALARDPDEPALYALLAKMYRATGLGQQEAESLDEARSLMTRDK